MSVVLSLITAPDANPTLAPHKISQQSGKDSLLVTFVPSEDITAWEIRQGAFSDLSISIGTLVEKEGRLICNRFKCGSGQTLSDEVFTGGVQIEREITYTEVGGGADGTRTVAIWEHPEDGAFS